MSTSRRTVSLLMRRASLAGLPARTRGKRTRRPGTITDLVRRDFRRSGPNQLWVTDITEHPTREGKVYWQTPIEFENTIRNRAPAPQIQVQKTGS